MQTTRTIASPGSRKPLRQPLRQPLRLALRCSVLLVAAGLLAACDKCGNRTPINKPWTSACENLTPSGSAELLQSLLAAR